MKNDHIWNIIKYNKILLINQKKKKKKKKKKVKT